ncbi:esterase-like activity of phytase family protein [Steroidobacter sp. S1-65]|uniref:Esterase-like activity of phytase family protein n=1 Tax=Steroidobacter gossypii TaxID=2805490 RepID=A0ABS1WVK9_9GAMM|nr:esterase-like activity of phytase family protein [Steroidobacter gossypii]MBM0105011.1 esterase-like activity of phytase family protein [Steroidobacter gossypii]
MRIFPGLIACCALSATFAAAGAEQCAATLRLIDVYSIPAGTRVNGDLLGGISGIDYDARTREWLLLSDDRSEHGPPRFFRAQLQFDSHQLTNVALLGAQHLKHATASNEDWIDPESIRLDPRRNELLIASEGDAQRRTGPWVRRADRTGRWLGEIPLPPTLDALTAFGERGPRPNRAIEGLAFAPNYRTLWIGLEAPLLQDGEPPNMHHGADIRFTRMAWPRGAIKQYVYAAEPARRHQPDESADNGISEILALEQNELLVLERSGIKLAAGGFRFHTRLYCASVADATDVASFDSLAGGTYTRMNKRLLLDFDDLPDVTADNLEAMGWGPKLANGSRSLVLASDNNFFANVATQLWIFEVRP